LPPARRCPVLEGQDAFGTIDQVHACPSEVAEDGGELAADHAAPMMAMLRGRSIDPEDAVAGHHALLRPPGCLGSTRGRLPVAMMK
jgi:hypothetical protein